jgi:ribosomal protein S3AE
MLFTEQFIKFHTENINLEQIPISINDAKFGIINLQATEAPLTEQNLEFIFMIDNSGSMSDRCSDGRSKMQHIIHTLKNMIRYFKENTNIKACVTIDTFDNKIIRVIERTNITNDNYNSIIAKIDEIIPQNTTNIEEALKSIIESAEDIREVYPDHTIINIFMTDGEVSDGNDSYSYLQNLVDRTITNAFIGFGIEHDSLLLNLLSNGENSAYYFIDKIESSGLVYGEILHGIFYKLVTNVKISVENGLIYNFKNNRWESSISIGDIVGEANKIYHVASSTPEDFKVSIVGINSCDSSDVNILISEKEREEDLTKYIYRQRTLQYLSFVGDFFNNNRLFNEEKNKIRKKLRDFIEEMKLYMKDNNLEDDKFLNNLCDDIYISYRTFGTKYGTMFNTSRRISQGAQRCYTASASFNSDRTVMMFANDIDHTLSLFESTPYLTPGATQVMRDISM